MQTPITGKIAEYSGDQGQKSAQNILRYRVKPGLSSTLPPLLPPVDALPLPARFGKIAEKRILPPSPLTPFGALKSQIQHFNS
ncbi:MAG: hypothetical protein ACYDBT_15705 [Desulfobulbaceae bacterium]